MPSIVSVPLLPTATRPRAVIAGAGLGTGLVNVRVLLPGYRSSPVGVTLNVVLTLLLGFVRSTATTNVNDATRLFANVGKSIVTFPVPPGVGIVIEGASAASVSPIFVSETNVVFAGIGTLTMAWPRLSGPWFCTAKA